MKFFTAFEIFRSLILSALAGCMFGCLYKASESILIAIRKLLFLIPDAFLSASRTAPRADKGRLSTFTNNLFEALIFLFFGIATILLMYIALDGVFRIYIVLTVVIFFVLSKKSIGHGFSLIFSFIFDKIYGVLFFLVSLVTKPIYHLVTFIESRGKILLSPIVLSHLKRRSNKIIKRKVMEINKNQ